MKSLAILGFLSIIFSLSAYEYENDCECGNPKKDPDYARALFALKLSIEKTPFTDEGIDFPEYVTSYYPPFKLRERSDDTYPYEGIIIWRIASLCSWNKALLWEYADIASYYSNYALKEYIPIRVTRRIGWANTPFEDEDDYRYVRTTFEFDKNYSAVPRAFCALKDDINMYLTKTEFFLDARIRDIAKKIPVYQRDHNEFYYYLAEEGSLLEKKQKIQSKCQQYLDFVNQKETEALEACTQSINWCMANHNNSFAFFDRGLFYYLEGNSEEAWDQINATLEKLKKEDLEELRNKALLLKGQTEVEVGMYANAVLTLTELINQNPEDKNAYFERAVANFELGEFDNSIQDYLQSEFKSPDVGKRDSFSIEYASALAEGIKKGFKEEFGDSLPSWASMMGFGLWTALSNSPAPSAKVVTATLSCVAAAGAYLAANQMVGELKDLVTNWESLSQKERGELSGYLIGKYGVNVFACAGSVKLSQAYRDLKKANNLLTFELAVVNEANFAVIKTKYKAVEKFNKDEAYIQKTFGRGHHKEMEIRDNLQKMGYLISKRPEGIPENSLTRYSDKGCGITYLDPANPKYNYDRLMPGKPHSPNPKQQQPYIIQMRNGQCLNIEGKIVPRDSTQAHISPEEYVFRPWNVKPK